MRKLDIMILGTGPAATRVAMTCSAAGRSVGVADPRPFGGTCALRGCNPKKVLVRAAELHDWIGRAEGTGVRVEGARIDWSELIAFKRTFTDPITPGKEENFRAAGIEAFHGRPRFIGPARIAVEEEEIECDRIVVATGAVPMALDMPGSEWLATSDDFLELSELPRRLVFVGGGYIAFEFAHVAVRAGAKVTILEKSPRVLGHFDGELVDCLLARSRELGIDIRVSTDVDAIEKRPGGSLVVRAKTAGRWDALEADLVVHGAGRAPNVADLDLEAGGVRYGPKGIEVDEHLRSVSNPAVYAAGDVAATAAPPLSPVAGEEGRVVAYNLLHAEPRTVRYGAVPTVVFSVPALAAVGPGEEEARRQGLQFTTRGGDRAGDNAMRKVGARHARYKVLVEERSGRILAAHLLGPDAAETINLFALAIQCGVTADDLKAMLFAFPTFSHDVRGML